MRRNCGSELAHEGAGTFGPFLCGLKMAFASKLAPTGSRNGSRFRVMGKACGSASTGSRNGLSFRVMGKTCGSAPTGSRDGLRFQAMRKTCGSELAHEDGISAAEDLAIVEGALAQEAIGVIRSGQATRVVTAKQLVAVQRDFVVQPVP